MCLFQFTEPILVLYADVRCRACGQVQADNIHVTFGGRSKPLAVSGLIILHIYIGLRCTAAGSR